MSEEEKNTEQAAGEAAAEEIKAEENSAEEAQAAAGTEEKTEETSDTAAAESETEKTGTDAPEAQADEEKKEEVTGKAGFFDKKKIKKLESKVGELEKKLAEAEAQNKEKDAKYLLLAAEYDNFRRRSQKEKDGIWTDAYSDAINKLLPVLDNLYRAVNSQDQNGLAEGLKMTVKSYEDALAKMGVEEIKAEGETFDPEKHSAVLHIEDENYGESQIVEVLAKGYMRDGKVIRYAVVKVAN